MIIIIIKCHLLISSAQDVILKCIVLSTDEWYSLYCQKKEKKILKRNHIFNKQGSENFSFIKWLKHNPSELIIAAVSQSSMINV